MPRSTLRRSLDPIAIAGCAALWALWALWAQPAHAALPAATGITWNVTPQQIADHCKQRIAEATARIKTLDEQPAGAGFGKGLLPIESAVADLSDALAAEAVLGQIAVTKDVRDAATKCSEDLADFGVKVGADPAILAFATTARDEVTATADRALVQRYVEAGRRSGAGLDAAKRKQATALFERLSKVQIAFQRELSEETPTIAITHDEATSLPPSFVATLKAKGSGYVVPVNESTALPFMKNEASSAARKRYRVAYDSRGGPANVKRLAEAVALRDRLAHLLGFKTWADYQLDTKMAKTPARAMALLAQVDEALLPKAREEVAVLAAMKRDGGDKAPMASWDYLYFENQLQKSKYAVDEEAVRRYFPVQKVIAAVFQIYEHLLGVRFEEIKPADAWAPDVLEYSITDVASGKAVGWFYLDLYPRAGKYEHFAMFPLRAGRVLPSGEVQKPVSAIIGNWPLAEPGKPALLTHDDVITFFHEFGHLMHNSLSTAPYETIFGANVRQDFVEAPSQMLENWMWQPSVLKQVSSEVDTGQPLPDELIRKMIEAKHVDDGVRWSRQVFYGTYDMTLHSSGAHVDPTRLWFDLSRKLLVFPAIPGTLPEAGFGHLVGGYDAGYYGYLWSLVYGQDMFSEFAKGGVDSAEVGMRYRKDILEPGGSIEPDVMLHNFLGRDVSYEPFYEYVGIKKLAP